MKRYFIFKTNMGWVGIAGTDGRISDLGLPRPSHDEAEWALKEGIEGTLVESEHDFSGAAEQIAAYFAGKRVEFKCEVDVSHAGSFDQRVWEAAKEIGYGERETYGGLAARIGCPRGARAVGQALGRNRIPLVIPCHRILRSDGALGGFGCGLEWKARLLALEQ
jgi:methylated-DNA-[protein]-cysteine S-methyltransferase